MEHIDWIHLGFTKLLLMRTTAWTDRVCHLQHYLKVFAAYITELAGHCDCVAYQDVKEPWYIIAKNAMLVFMLNVLNYTTQLRAVCKSDFLFFFLSLFIILSIEHKILRNQIKIICIKVIERWKLNYFLRCIIYAWVKWQKNHSLKAYFIFFSLYLQALSWCWHQFKLT